MAVEIIFQCGDKKYWEEHWKNKDYMSEVLKNSKKRADEVKIKLEKYARKQDGNKVRDFRKSINK